MGIKDYIEKKRKEKLPLIARVDLTELQKQREKDMEDREVSILAAADYTRRITTIRLYYIALQKFMKYGSDQMMVGQTYGVSSPFRLPNGMTFEDAFKVVSYLSDKVETENELNPASEESVVMVSQMLDKYGFSRVEGEEKGPYHAICEYRPFYKIKPAFPVGEKIEGVVDLFTVGGDFKIFKKTDLYDRYFDWYIEGISQQEIADIYKNIGQSHWLPNNQNSENKKSL